MTQPAPPADRAVPQYSRYPAGYPAAFVAWHDAQPWVYAAIVRRAYQLRDEGHTAVGLRYLFEDVRYSKEARRRRANRPAWEMGLNNNFSTWYGRLIEAQETDLKGFCRLRRTEEEIETLQVVLDFGQGEQSGQVAMEVE